ncbi:hypothetical protein HYH03_019035 [Edaphochlamys debaryana]|uniref:Protein kinase domain-containing protein n=1 Tax=Edaphochlamys debaryana TaxID=47281 RepID=A0A835XE53_9CHLO|nr:hypothetical protein HYH03_019035 [Edaphochlamys debaryana]|eukprot:KAG2482011.1 hypothetical protein HYH03_019035 [Edaphochlamys debaryana]
MDGKQPGEAGLAPHQAVSIDPGDLEIGHTQIGSGGFGRVMLGKHRGVAVAVKLLPLAGSAADKARLENEVKILARVSATCAYACRLYGVCTKDSNLAIVMKLYKGNLRAHIENQPDGRVPAERAVILAQDLLRGLAELHGNLIVVADLKPDNVLISDVDMPLFCDFCISKAVTTTIGRYLVTRAEGTPNYMSPEQFATDEDSPEFLTPASDMWGFAATMLHVLSGAPPWGGKPPHVIIMKVGMQKQAPQLPPGLPPPLEALLVDCFKPRPEDRPTAVDALRRVGAMIESGQHLSSGGAHPASPPPAPVPAPAPSTPPVSSSSDHRAPSHDKSRLPKPSSPLPTPQHGDKRVPPPKVLSYVQLSPSYEAFGDAKDGPLGPGKYGIVLYDVGSPEDNPRQLLVLALTEELVPRARWWYARGALQAVPEAAVPEALRLRPWRSADGRRGVPVCPGNARMGMLVQRGCHWRNDTDRNGLDGELGVLVGSIEEGMVWRVHWANGSRANYCTGKYSLFELAHVQVHERAGSPVFDGDGSLPGAAVMRGWGWCRGGEDGAPFAVGSLEPCDKEGCVNVRWEGQGTSNCDAHARHISYDLSHAVRPGEPVTVFTARKGLKVVRGPAWNACDVDGGGKVDGGSGGSGVGELLEPAWVTGDKTGIVWRVRWGSSRQEPCHRVCADGGRSELQHPQYGTDGVLQLGTPVRLASGGAGARGAAGGPLCAVRGDWSRSLGVVVGAEAGSRAKSKVTVMALRDQRTWAYDRSALEPLPGHLAKQLTLGVVLNRDGRAAFPGLRGGPGGDTGRDSGDVFYCGARMGQCRCGSCDGVCGPDAGCPCHACLELTGLRVGPRRAGAAGGPPALQPLHVNALLKAERAAARQMAAEGVK